MLESMLESTFSSARSWSPTLALGLVAALAASPVAHAVGGDDADEAVVDQFHPDKGDGKAPLYGGRAIVHVPSLPENMCYPIENSAVTRRFLYETHETLLLQDWWSHEYVPDAAASWVEEDLVVLKPDAPAVEGEIAAQVVRRGEGETGLREVRAVYGSITDAGANWTISPMSKGSSIAGPVQVPKGAVERVERGTVFTVSLREGVRWQPSLVYSTEQAAKFGEQFLDADDVYYSWSIYRNPEVNCDEKRFQFEKIVDCEVVDELTVRFFYERQYAYALESIGTSLTLLPSHIYNLLDVQCPDHDAGASLSKQAEHLNKNPHNKLWVGLGPYQVTEWTQQYVEVERFVGADGKPAYFDAATRPGYFDTIRWRYIDNDEAAMNALLNGEVDFFDRVKSEDYSEGGRATSKSFEKEFYKGDYYLGAYGYTGWNLYRPQVKDIAVRKAIAMAFDFEGYRKTQYNGKAHQITGPVPYTSEGYPRDMAALPYDPDGALDMLEEAGWYDRNGDGIADKDGVELVIEFLYPSGNDASKLFGIALQSAVEELGIKINLASLEWATFLERIKSREFDACNLAWVPPLESDPEQLWHSKWGARDKKSSNNSGVMDPKVDAMIEGIQAEIDREARMALWREFHRYIYEEVQPYLFMYNVPKKFGASLKVRGIRNSAIDPGYVIRDWYFVDPSVKGTRSSLEK
ncbi:ABC transporter substrate-binding protein [Planctomycetota bacterium]|nr:ABC transporter substrate-binding protein [Planctomycetota bacterium]